MNKTVGQLLKEIRIANNLTQKKFADKFYLTQKTVSNYETGKRKPDIDFIRTVCREFSVSLDYFTLENNESDSRDLIAVSRNNKQALFDKKQGTYLTPFNYDTIIISEFGPHIAVKLDKEGSYKETALVNNKGEIKKFENLIFGHKSMFSIEQTIIAVNYKTKKYYIMDNNGNLLTNGYNMIVAINKDKLPIMFVAKSNNNGIVLLDLKGNIIDAKIKGDFEDEHLNWAFITTKIENIDSMEKVYEYVKKYGNGILSFLNYNLFDKISTYCMVFKGLSEYLSTHNNLTQQQLVNQFRICIDSLESYTLFRDYDPNKLDKEDYDFFENHPFEMYIKNVVKNRIARNLIIKDIDSFRESLFNENLR